MPDASPFDLPPDMLDAAGAAFGGDAGERDQALARLVAAHPEHAAGLRRLAASLVRASDMLATTFAVAESDPVQIGPFRLVRRLGEGAFGIVHLAEQQAPIRRQVAIKVLRPGVGDRTTVQRFAAERQLLASFQHPAIANVIDAGELPDGRPWFAMEYVAGAAITTWCDEHRLDVAQRLRLFLELCLGVAHAHARGVVHRDLKPANVLVTTLDGEPRPKIIDFGIAKALWTDDPTAREATVAGRVVGTPGYMSPEQSRGDSHRVDARSDVFSLGVMLFELLTGTLPWPRGAAATEEPPRPSTRIRTDAAHAAIADRRASDARSLTGRLRGELDWIVLQALQHDPALRYADAQALAADVSAHLQDRPIRACPPAWRQTLMRALRRHRHAMLAGSALLVIGLLALLALQLLSHARASAFERVGMIAEAVDRLLRQAKDPQLAELADAARVREAALHDAAALLDRLEHESSIEPLLRARRAQIHHRLAALQRGYGQHRVALELAQRGADEVEALLRLPDPVPDLQETRALAWLEVATNRIELRQYDEAFAASENSLQAFAAWRRDHAGSRVREHASAWAMQANCLLGQRSFDAANTAFRRGIEVLDVHRSLHPDDQEAQRLRVRLGCGFVDVCLQRRASDDALAAANELLAALQSMPAPSAEDRAVVHRRVAGALRAKGRAAEAAPHWRQCADFAEAALQRQPRSTHLADLVRVGCTELAMYLYQTGELAEADRVADRAMAFADAAKDESPAWAQCYAYSAGRIGLFTQQTERSERYALVVGWLRRALAPPAAGQAAPSDSDRALCMAVLGVLCHLTRQPFAVAEWQQALQLAKAHYPGNVATVATELAWRQWETGDTAGARASLAEAARHGDAHAVDPVRVAAWCELTEGDVAEALRVVDAGLAAHAETWMLLLDAQVSFAAVVATGRAAAPAADALPALQERATAAWRRCLEHFRDGRLPLAAPVRELVVAQARIALACLGSPLESAAGDLAEALPVLEALRERVPPRAWRDEPWGCGWLTSIRLAAASGDRSAAERDLARWLEAATDAALLLDGATVALATSASARAAGDTAAVASFDALAVRAMCRAREQQRDAASFATLLAAPCFAALRQHPQFAAATGAAAR